MCIYKKRLKFIKSHFWLKKMIKDIEYIIKKILFKESYLLKKRLIRAINKNYEKELNVISKFSDKTKDALDVGVYRGVYSYKLAQYFKTIHSFEPNPLLYPYLEKNLSIIIDNIKLYNLALSDTNGVTELKLPLRSKSIFKDNIEELFKLGAATIHKKKELDNFNKIQVHTKKLDDISFTNEIGFIKIDVEGHEKNVIMGGIETIKKNMPVLLIEIEERHTKTPAIETINYIKSFGYEVYIYNNNELMNLSNCKNILDENNFIFLKR